MSPQPVTFHQAFANALCMNQMIGKCTFHHQLYWGQTMRFSLPASGVGTAQYHLFKFGDWHYDDGLRFGVVCRLGEWR